MSEIRQQDMGLAALYADSMLELAEAEGNADDLLDELLELGRLLRGDGAFDRFLTGVTVDSDARSKSLEKIFRGRASDLLTNTLLVLNRRGRLMLIHSIIEAYRLGHERLRNQVDVFVKTAVPLADELRGQVIEATRAISGKEPQLIERVDDSIIGGLVVQIGDEKYDNSVATKLKNLRGMLLERASQEIHSGKHAYTQQG